MNTHLECYQVKRNSCFEVYVFPFQFIKLSSLPTEIQSSENEQPLVKINSQVGNIKRLNRI